MKSKCPVHGECLLPLRACVQGVPHSLAEAVSRDMKAERNVALARSLQRSDAV